MIYDLVNHGRLNKESFSNLHILLRFMFCSLQPEYDYYYSTIESSSREEDIYQDLCYIHHSQVLLSLFLFCSMFNVMFALTFGSSQFFTSIN